MDENFSLLILNIDTFIGHHNNFVPIFYDDYTFFKLGLHRQGVFLGIKQRKPVNICDHKIERKSFAKIIQKEDAKKKMQRRRCKKRDLKI